MAKELKIRDRIVGLERHKARDLKPHVLNPRIHGEAQTASVKKMLESLGMADRLLAFRDMEGNLRLIDGHLRRSLTGDMEVPVLVTDLNEEEAAMLLAVGDPLAALADRDDAVMKELLAQTNGDLLAELLAGNDALAELLGQGAVLDVQFPEYGPDSFNGVEDEAAEVTFKVRLGDVPVIEEQVERIARLIGAEPSEKGRALMMMVRLAARLEDQDFV